MTTEPTPGPGLPPAPPAAALPPPAAPVNRPTSTLAIVSLVSGLLGILGAVIVLPIVASIVAVVTGHMARAEIRNSHGAIDGDGLALAGLITGYVMIALAVLVILAVVLFFGGIAALLAFAGAAATI